MAVLSDSKMTQGKGKCEGLEQGKTWGRKWQEVGSRAAPAPSFQLPRPSENTLLAQAQEFISVPEGPRAFLGHSSERAEGSGTSRDFRS